MTAETAAPVLPDETGRAAKDSRAATARRLARRAVPPVIVAACVIGVWFFVSYVTLSPSRRFLLPPPQQVISVGLGNSLNRSNILSGLGVTAEVALVGLVIAIALGTAFAVVMSQARWLEDSLYPWAVVLQTIPILAIIPVIGFWFQYGYTARLIVCVLISLFPVTTNTLFGLKSADRAHRDLFRLRGASRWQVLTKLQLPGALPSIFTGWRISAGLSVIGAIVGDFFFQQGPVGLGRLINGYTQQLQSDQLFASVIVASLLGLAVFWAFGLLARAVVGPWHESQQDQQSD
ncbi:MAG TPA: ABC transporter permease [Streptosporangiaceae bacterium]